MPHPIHTPEYWIEEFKPTRKDVEALSAFMLEHLTPQTAEDLAFALIEARVEKALELQQRRRDAEGTVYQPSDRYDVGQQLVFSALDGLEGVVAKVRAGNNAAYGKYDVIEVELDGRTRAFAAGLTWEHPLSETEVELDAAEIAERFAPVIAPQLASQLASDADWMSYGDRWILNALLPDVNKGHLNLAEAVIMLAGEPLPAEQLLEEIEIDEGVPADARALALELALNDDDRFRNVGALESPLWTLSSQA